MNLRDRIERRLVPRTIVALSTIDGPRRLQAALHRLRGGRGTVELFVAFDDAYSAVALVGLADRLASRPVDLVVQPVVERGIPGDPAVAAKRRYAVTDAARLAQRDGHELSRTEVVPVQEAAFLARWTAAAPDERSRTAFAVAAMRRLWFEQPSGAVEPDAYADLWRRIVGGDPPPADADVVTSERRMERRKLYDTPVAVVAGQWFFAHERLPQIAHRLDDLGWRAAA